MPARAARPSLKGLQSGDLLPGLWCLATQADPGPGSALVTIGPAASYAPLS
ncbi:hypothetical protein AB0L74_29130 [Streptomyces sp. NPDC052020]|uniref:hypothetical protein n=1 Tax=Streptomyces sp. NPDC052020 TaxID=3155677 RepID=UPI00342D2A96